jgi:hypothetical protein
MGSRTTPATTRARRCWRRTASGRPTGPASHEALGRYLRAVFAKPPADRAAREFDRLRRARNQDRYEAKPVGAAATEKAEQVARTLLSPEGSRRDQAVRRSSRARGLRAAPNGAANAFPQVCAMLRRADASPAAGSAFRPRFAGWSRSRSASPRSGSRRSGPCPEQDEPTTAPDRSGSWHRPGVSDRYALNRAYEM